MAAVAAGRDGGFDLAIRGGGHSVPGFGTVDDGLVIDLSPMKNVWVDPVKKVVRVGGGATWGDVDHATYPFGLAAPGGIISTTGVGGLTLGGGIGYLTRGVGLSIDNLLSADVVLADGQQVTASDYQNLQSFLSGLAIPIVPLDEETAGRSRNMLLVLLGAISIVLLIVYADVANLMLTRFGFRRREIAIRSSLGASSPRIVRQLLTEPLALGMLGSAFGLLFASFAMRALLSFGAETLPRAESITFNERVLWFAALLALLASLAPAWRAIRVDPIVALKTE